MKTKQKLLAMIMALFMTITCLVSPAMATPAEALPQGSTVTGETAVTSALTPNPTAKSEEKVSIMVQLEDKTTFMQTSDIQLAAASHNEQMAVLAQAETRIETVLNETVEIEDRFSLLFNGFTFTGESWMIDAINELDGMTAFVEPVFSLVEPEVDESVNLTPSMSDSTQLIGVTTTWDLGYTGEGMVVGVIDTGIRQTHEAFSVMPENGKIDKAYLENMIATYGDKLHCGTNVDDIHYNEKLPFNWDYYDNDAIPNHTGSDHGSHVAGTAAGNNGKGFKGVAPDAQIASFQVFNPSVGAAFSELLAAMEDCVYLGVDAINMSLGSAVAHPSYDAIPGMEAVFELLENAGITVCAAAGNDMTSAYYTNLGKNPAEAGWFAWNVDGGTHGAPGVYTGPIAVASAVNELVEAIGFFTAYGRDWYPAAVAENPNLSDLEDREYQIVSVGQGSPEEIQAADSLAGKIVLVERSALSLTEVSANAQAAGAVGILVFNNESGTFTPEVSSTIPFGVMTGEDGEALLANLRNGTGAIAVDNGIVYRNLKMADTSSWGPAADLRLKPEITAPGHYIYSVAGLYNDTGYQSMSGTSMATPHIAGSVLLVKQRLQEVFPEKTAIEINELVHSLLMSTAHQTSALVRKAGAGIMDAKAAVTTEAYITVPGSDRPKLELGDSEEGVFSFTFEVTNFGENSKTYTVVPSVLTEKVMDVEYSGYRESTPGAAINAAVREWNQKHHFFLSNPTPVNVKVVNGTALDVTDMCDITAPDAFTVAPEQTVKVEMTIKASEELMAFFQENFEAGAYLEGYINLREQAVDGIDLSIPFLGFVGDWGYAPMIDLGFWWQIPYGQNNMAVMPVSHGTFLGAATMEQGLGLNPYADETGHTYVADRNAISPNGDGFYDALTYLEFSTLRTPKVMKIYVQDADGKVLKTIADRTHGWYKDYLVNGQGPTYSYWSMNYAAEDLQENETAYFVLEAWLDHEGYDPDKNMNGRIVIPFTKDLTAPAVKVVDGGIEVVDAQYTAYYAIYADEARTELLYETGVFAEERGVAERYETDLTTFYVATADYARNEAFYQVDNGVVVALEDDGFDHSTREIVGRQYADGNTGENQYGWISFRLETPNQITNLNKLSADSEYGMDPAAAVYNPDITTGVVADDGTLYIHNPTSLFTVDQETWESTKVADFSVPGYTLSLAPAVRALLKNPETGAIYAQANLSGDNGLGFGAKWICALDPETGVLTPLWDHSFAKLGVTPFYSWAFCFVDGDTIAVYDYWNKNARITLHNAEDGTMIGEYLMDMVAPGTEAQVQLGGGGASMLYDSERNAFYIFSRWGWFRWYKYDFNGFIEYDVDTGTTTMRSVGLGAGPSMHGLFFADEMKPADWYTTIELIKAIGEVTTESGDAIEAAREAYDALSDADKEKVYNYEDLVQAEHRYCIVMGEKYANDAQKSAEDAQKAYEDAKKEAEDAKKAAEDAQKAYEDAVKETAENKEAAEKAQKAAEEAQKKAEEAQAKAEAAKAASEAAQAKAEAAQKAAEDAAKAAEESNQKAAAEALKAAEEAAKAADEAAKAAESAAEAAESAADAAESAQAAAEAQAKAQAAQAAAEKAQKAAEDAQKKAEEAQKKAEEAAESSAEDKEAAEKAKQAAEEAQEAAEAAQEAAEQARDAAAASAAAAEESNKAAAESAALAAQYAQEVAEMYLEIVEIKAEMTDMLAEAQKAQEAAEAAALASAKYFALTEITALTLDTTGYTDHQIEDLAEAVKAAQEAIKAAATIAEVEAIVEEFKAELEVIEASCPAKAFDDVAVDVWYHEAVDYVALNGLMNGKGDGIFAPNANLTRAELVTVLYRMAGEPSVEGMTHPFADVAAGTWYTDAVIWAYNAEVVKGISDTAFAPGANITREQIATIMYRFSEAEAVTEDALADFADADKVSDWAVEAMNWAVSVGLINGVAEDTLAPQGNATRAQIATILMRYCEN